ncbi:GTP pyrophosphokinase [Mumia qirimensis]|uniref:GTP pyrophosphokinase n=1 Tax=Mumia qirimensis TaxID=3234852 RepID=UPI00351CC82E
MADAWLENYRRNYSVFRDAAKEVRKQIEESISGRPFSVQVIEARAKDPGSAAEKVGRKKYGRPGQQMDDILGVRIITLYEHNVVEVADRLRAAFEVDESRSGDKTKQLGMGQVGYRSSHLVLKPRKSGLGRTSRILESTRVEVQIRSVVAHAWAEIEHSLRYKIGTGVPNELLRRFDALAGALELIDREFSGIEKAIVDEISELCRHYSSGRMLSDPISTIQLLGVMAAARRHAAPLGPHGLALEIEDAFLLSKLLRASGILTVDDLMSALASPDSQAVIRRYAESDPAGYLPENASAFVTIGAIIGLRRPELLGSTSIGGDPRLISAFE